MNVQVWIWRERGLDFRELGVISTWDDQELTFKDGWHSTWHKGRSPWVPVEKNEWRATLWEFVRREELGINDEALENINGSGLGKGHRNGVVRNVEDWKGVVSWK